MLQERKAKVLPAPLSTRFFVKQSRIGMSVREINDLISVIFDTETTLGLYTSPHLVAVRERIRINGQPISEELFAKYFFDVWDKLEATADNVRPSPSLIHSKI